MRILPYLRVSTDKQDTDRQRAAIEQYATANGHELLHWVEEANGISGRSKAVKTSARKALQYYSNLALGSAESLERPGLDTLLETVRERDVDAVVLYSLDRLTRDCCELLLLERYLSLYDCSLIAINQGGTVDTSTAAGKFMFRVLAAQCEFECDLVSERTQQALKVKKANGQRVGGRPLGWRKKGDAWVPQEIEQEKMRSARMLHMVGHTYRELSAALGIPLSSVKSYLTASIDPPE